MKVQIDTKDKTVYVSANNIADSVEAINRWIKALQTARDWLEKELAVK